LREVADRDSLSIRGGAINYRVGIRVRGPLPDKFQYPSQGIGGHAIQRYISKAFLVTSELLCVSDTAPCLPDFQIHPIEWDVNEDFLQEV